MTDVSSPEVIKLQEQIARLRTGYRQALKDLRQRHKEEIRQLRAKILEEQRQAWLKRILTLNYANETEVELKFIYPLLRFLGFSEDQIHLRVPVQIPAGRHMISGEADWVVDAPSGSPRFVIEAKASQVPLTEQTMAQARSYAISLGIPLYVLTNGKAIQVYERGVNTDTCLLNISVEELPKHWDALARILTGQEQAPRKSHSAVKWPKGLGKIALILLLLAALGFLCLCVIAVATGTPTPTPVP